MGGGGVWRHIIRYSKTVWHSSLLIFVPCMHPYVDYISFKRFLHYTLPYIHTCIFCIQIYFIYINNIIQPNVRKIISNPDLFSAPHHVNIEYVVTLHK